MFSKVVSEIIFTRIPINTELAITIKMIVYSVQLVLLIGVIGNYAYYMVTAHGDILLLGVRQYPYIEAAACLRIGLLSVLSVPVHHSLF